jgi:hypothetical protein
MYTTQRCWRAEVREGLPGRVILGVQRRLVTLLVMVLLAFLYLVKGIEINF